MYAEDNLIWIDLEMTGLDTKRDEIIELALIITNSQCEIIAEAPVWAVHQSDAVLDGMDEWNTRVHGGSGLIERVRQSDFAYAAVEAQAIEFLEKYVPSGVSPMCGNSICQDRRFLARHMPALEKYFHYRHLDVSTLKILADMWYTDSMPALQKSVTHQALQDVRDSIDELKHYREHMLKKTKD